MIRNNIRNLVIGFAVGSLGLALAVAIPNTFTNGTVISSSAVNANFAALTTATTVLEEKTAGFGRSGNSNQTSFSDSVVFNKHIDVTGTTTSPLTLLYFGNNGFANPEIKIERKTSDFGRIRFRAGPNIFWDIAANNTEFRIYSKATATDIMVINDGTTFSTPSRVSINGELNVTGTVFANVTPLSDKNGKTDFSQINSRDVLKKVSNMAVSSWRYKTEPQNMRHVGVMAQDFYKQFGLGADNKHINTVDADGVMVASIQALNSLVLEKDAKIQTLEKRVSQLESLEARLTKLEAARR
jgi:hypothetical protein